MSAKKQQLIDAQVKHEVTTDITILKNQHEDISTPSIPHGKSSCCSCITFPTYNVFDEFTSPTETSQ